MSTGRGDGTAVSTAFTLWGGWGGSGVLWVCSQNKALGLCLLL